jgi:hypothetical protein
VPSAPPVTSRRRTEKSGETASTSTMRTCARRISYRRAGVSRDEIDTHEESADARNRDKA